MSRPRMTTGELLCWGMLWLLFLWPLSAAAIVFITLAMVAGVGQAGAMIAVLVGGFFWLAAVILPLMHGIDRCRLLPPDEYQAAIRATDARKMSDEEWRRVERDRIRNGGKLDELAKSGYQFGGGEHKSKFGAAKIDEAKRIAAIREANASPLDEAKAQ